MDGNATLILFQPHPSLHRFPRFESAFNHRAQIVRGVLNGLPPFCLVNADPTPFPLAEQSGGATNSDDGENGSEMLGDDGENDIELWDHRDRGNKIWEATNSEQVKAQELQEQRAKKQAERERQWALEQVEQERVLAFRNISPCLESILKLACVYYLTLHPVQANVYINVKKKRHGRAKPFSNAVKFR